MVLLRRPQEVLVQRTLDDRVLVQRVEHLVEVVRELALPEGARPVHAGVCVPGRCGRVVRAVPEHEREGVGHLVVWLAGNDQRWCFTGLRGCERVSRVGVE